VELHQRLLGLINLSALDTMSRAQIQDEVGDIIEEELAKQRHALNAAERRQLTDDVLDELLGLGPLEPLLKDPTINDILVNGHNSVFVERYGQLEASPVRFKDERHLLRIIQKIVSAVGRRVDESSPLVDARLADGSRVNAVVPPLALDGSLLSIRKFAKVPISLARLVEIGSVPAQVAEVLQAIVAARLNVLISGGTGSGKTTMLNAMSSFIDERERIVTIEDSAELQLQQAHVARLETRPPNIEGKGEIAQRDLVKNALRMRPDRIIVGEVRAGEAFDMLQAMNTGHDGSMTTVHANNPRDSRPDQLGDPHRRAGRAPVRRAAAVDEPERADRDGKRHHHDAGNIPLSPDRGQPGRERVGPVRGDRDPPALPRSGDGARLHLVRRAVPSRGEFRLMAESWIRVFVLVCVFAAVLISVEMIVGLFAARRSESNAINQRLKMIERGVSRVQTMSILRRQTGVGSANLPAFLVAPGQKLEKMLVQAGIVMPTGRLLLIVAVAPAAVFVLLVLLSASLGVLGAGRLFLLFIVAIVVGLALPLMILCMRATGMRKKIIEQFPVALDVFVRGLRAGHPIAAALDLLTVEMPDPIGSQFGLVVDEVTYGADLRDALEGMADRWDLDDMRMFVVSLSVQSETGGNLAEILENLSRVIRERASMMMKVRALSSEGRMSAIMLTVLPVGSFVLLFILNPAFYLDVADDSMFIPGFAGLIAMYVLGVLIIRRMVDLKV